MKYLLLCLLVVFSGGIEAQRPALLDCAIKSDTSIKQANVEIYIFSDPGCGFCRRAIKDIGEWSKGKPVHIIAMDLSGKPESVKQLDFYLQNNIEVRDAGPCDEKVKKFIPQIYIRETKTNKQVMKVRGWHKRDLGRLERKLKRYI